MISLPIWAVILISIVAIAVIITATWAYLTAQRLHRLHKRCEQTAIALEGALDRRALSARMAAREMRRVAADLTTDPDKAAEIVTDANTISHCAHIVESTVCTQLLDMRERETVENDLTLVLRRLDFSYIGREYVADLQEAALRVNLARRFYNNAVREARTVQTMPMVQFLHLAGHAPKPYFFNIVDQSWPDIDVQTHDDSWDSVELENSSHAEQD